MSDQYISIAPYYDELTRDVPYSVFADFYEDIFKKYHISPRIILDLACGTGTLTCLMAERGYEMIGADVSEDMLAVAVEKAGERKFPVMPMFLNQSMDGLDLYGTVDACVCSLDGINYIPPDILPEVFHRLRLFIAPGGVFVFDINSPFKLKNLDGQIFLDETDDVFCVWRSDFSNEKNCCFYGFDIFFREEDKWVRGQEEHTEYAHSAVFLTELLKKNGFTDISIYGELTLSEPKETEDRIFIAARRVED